MSQTAVDQHMRDSQRIVIDEIESEMNISLTNGVKMFYCEAVGCWTSIEVVKKTKMYGAASLLIIFGVLL